MRSVASSVRPLPGCAARPSSSPGTREQRVPPGRAGRALRGRSSLMATLTGRASSATPRHPPTSSERRAPPRCTWRRASGSGRRSDTPGGAREGRARCLRWSASRWRGARRSLRRGTLSSSPRVYGWRGAANTSATGPVSTTRAAYITTDLLGVLGDHAEIVRDEERRSCRATLLQLAQERRGSAPGWSRRGLSSARRPRGAWARSAERHRDHHALALPARELVRVARRRSSRGIRAGRRGAGASIARARGRRLARGAPVQAHALGDLPADGVDGVEARHRLLEDHRDPVAADVSLHLRARGA